MKKCKATFMLIALLLAAAVMQIPSAVACTRMLYVGNDGLVLTGRSMDWFEEMNTDLWIFPRGMKRTGEVGAKSVKWTSKYGSLVADLYKLCSGEGMNEKGLGVNLLYLAESDYGTSNDRKRISIGAWVQYVLDNYATVEEAVSALQADQLQVVAPSLPNGKESSVHFALSDPTGDSAIVEWINGEQVIHHGKQYQVMTNSPTYDKQLALSAYWKEIGGLTMLPGTNRAADRFARADYYINALPKTSDTREGVASVMSVVRNVSVPRGIIDPTKPNIASTIWRSVLDHKNKVYYYEPTSSPCLFWVSLDNLDFSKGAPVKKLELENDRRILSGEASGLFIEAQPFKYITDQK